jgi:hypothetical protein
VRDPNSNVLIAVTKRRISVRKTRRIEDSRFRRVNIVNFVNVFGDQDSSAHDLRLSISVPSASSTVSERVSIEGEVSCGAILTERISGAPGFDERLLPRVSLLGLI